jgi:hypothetical protein
LGKRAVLVKEAIDSLSPERTGDIIAAAIVEASDNDMDAIIVMKRIVDGLEAMIDAIND